MPRRKVLRTNKDKPTDVSYIGVPSKVVSEIFDIPLGTLRQRVARNQAPMREPDADMYSTVELRSYLQRLIAKAEYRGRQSALREKGLKP